MRTLKVLVVLMGVLLVVGFAVLVGTIIGRITQRAASSSAAVSAQVPRPTSFGAATVALPPGARVVGMRGAGGRLVLRLMRPDGSEALVVIDPDTGAEIGTIELKSGK